MLDKKIGPGNFRRVEFEIKVRMPLDTEELKTDSDILITRIQSSLLNIVFPFTTIGKFLKLRESDFFQDYPEKTREYRIVFYADITKV